MRFDNPVPLKDIAAIISARLVGNIDASATGINEIHVVEKGDLVFVDHPKYYESCIQSAASFIIIDKEAPFPEGKALLIVDQPFEAYLKIVEYFQPFKPSMQSIAPSASIHPDSIIMPNVYIGNNVTIGAGSVIYPHVSIMDGTIIGKNVIIQSATVIGSDAFYYNKKNNRAVHYKKMTSCGHVILEDYVEIGAGCTIDRGVTGITKIGAGTKIDNQVHIGHDSIIGKNCLFASQVGIAGAVVIEDEVTIWGQVGISKTLTIGKGAVINAKSGVPGSLEGGKIYFGYPVGEAKEKLKEVVWIKRIPEMWQKLKNLDKS